MTKRGKVPRASDRPGPPSTGRVGGFASACRTLRRGAGRAYEADRADNLHQHSIWGVPAGARIDFPIPTAKSLDSVAEVAKGRDSAFCSTSGDGLADDRMGARPPLRRAALNRVAPDRTVGTDFWRHGGRVDPLMVWLSKCIRACASLVAQCGSLACGRHIELGGQRACRRRTGCLERSEKWIAHSWCKSRP